MPARHSPPDPVARPLPQRVRVPVLAVVLCAAGDVMACPPDEGAVTLHPGVFEIPSRPSPYFTRKFGRGIEDELTSNGKPVPFRTGVEAMFESPPERATPTPLPTWIRYWLIVLLVGLGVLGHFAAVMRAGLRTPR
jgi:hypothetical protein